MEKRDGSRFTWTVTTWMEREGVEVGAHVFGLVTWVGSQSNLRDKTH